MRKAGRSKYCMGNKSAPPSVAVATIFGVWVSTKPSVMRCSRPYCRTLPLSRNMALTWALRRSRNRLSRRVSSSTFTLSVTPNGSGASACNDVDRCGQDFVCWWRGGRSVFHFGWALEGHGARELERGLSRHPLNHVQSFLADVVGFQEDLSLAGPVSEVNKTNGSFSTVGFHETDDGDFVSDEVAALRLQFTEGVRTVSGWYPCGHGGGVEAHNMNHSLRKADIPPTECSTE